MSTPTKYSNVYKIIVKWWLNWHFFFMSFFFFWRGGLPYDGHKCFSCFSIFFGGVGYHMMGLHWNLWYYGTIIGEDCQPSASYFDVYQWNVVLDPQSYTLSLVYEPLFMLMVTPKKMETHVMTMLLRFYHLVFLGLTMCEYDIILPALNPIKSLSL